MFRKLTIFVLALFIAVPYVYADGDAWELGGQVRVRSEIDGKDFQDATNANNFANLRTRFFVGKTIGNELKLFIQLQDTRLFGSEGGTLNSTFNVDLHQAYALLMNPFAIPLMLQAGRFEVSYGTQRFFGAVGWHNVGRAFDGVRFQDIAGIGLDLFALTEHQSGVADTETKSIYGAWYQTKIGKKSDLHGFIYHEADREDTYDKDGEQILALARSTLGLTYLGNYGTFGTIFEAAYQMGTIGQTDISAYLVSVYLQYLANAFNFGVGVDLVSGHDPKSETYGAFNQQYGTNHKFYGFMDYFLNMPASFDEKGTNTHGLTDIYAKLNLKPKDCQFSYALAFHMFMAAQAMNIWNIDDAKENEETAIGSEIDLTVNYSFIPGTTISLGGSVFMPGAIFEDKKGSDIAFWTYLMLTANIR